MKVVRRSLSYGRGLEKGIRYINIIDADKVSRKMKIFDSGEETQNDKTPLVFIGGTAQTITTYYPHLKILSKNRRVIIPEMRCQGDTELLSKFASPAQFFDDFQQLITILQLERIDLGGFSFGGRICLNIAAFLPSLIRKLSISGVPYVRPFLGKTILYSWKEGLRDGHLRQCAWSFILNGYSESFIEENHNQIPKFVEMIIKDNSTEKLFHLLSYSHVECENDPFSTQSCAPLVACPTQLLVGSQDRICDPRSVQELAEHIPNAHFKVIPPCGHLLHFERPLIWRKLLLDFLDHDSSSPTS